MDLLSAHRKQYLPSAAALLELCEDQTNDFLHTSVGIETKAYFSVPSGAKRYGDSQFATPRLGTRGVKHAAAQVLVRTRPCVDGRT